MDSIRVLFLFLLAAGPLNAAGSAEWDTAYLRGIGRRLVVDKIVAGTYLTHGDRNVLVTEHVDVKTGKVTKTQRFWSRPGAPAPTAPVIEDKQALALRDSISDSSCSSAGARVNVIEKDLLDIKSRYWALELKKGAIKTEKPRKFNPGIVITDPRLRKQFDGQVQRWSSQKSIPPLTLPEAQKFFELETKVFQLARRCDILK